MKKVFGLTAFLLLATVVLSGCTKPRTQPTGGGSSSSTTGSEEASSGEIASDIVETANETGEFQTLVAAVKAAGLVETLKGEGPFTVFAPTDAAFDALPDGTVEDLLKPENKEKLVAILTYHVVAGKVMAADTADLESATTVQGKDVTVKVEGEAVMINGATVEVADIECSNGVIHAIDTVLMPPSE